MGEGLFLKFEPFYIAHLNCHLFIELMYLELNNFKFQSYDKQYGINIVVAT
jgi:hypothetical protein